MGVPTYEFILWPNCHNNCSFCFQKEQIKKGVLRDFIDFERRTSIQRVKDFLYFDLPRGSNVMLVGGELFDHPSIQNDLLSLLDLVGSLMYNRQINELYLNTNLIYKKLDTVLFFLNTCRILNILSRIHFTTSYDFDGRFSKSSANTMLSNLMEIRKAFPQCPIYVNTMLSRKCCENIIDGTFSVKEFSQKFDCYVNLIPYIELTSDITAPRHLIIKALQKVDTEIPGYVSDYLTRLDINQEKYVFQYDLHKDKLVDCSCKNSKCGHSVNFTKYSSNGSCYICDMKLAFGLM